MKLNTNPRAMLRTARKVALGYSDDGKIMGVLARHPMPDDSDFPETCDVELAVVTRNGVDPWKEGYGLTRRWVGDVLVDICATDVSKFQSGVTNPTWWLLSLGDPRAYMVLCDFDSGNLTELFARFKTDYLVNASNRLPIWLQEARQHLLVALDIQRDMNARFAEAAFALAYLTAAMLDMSGRTYAGTFLRLPRNLGWVSDELAKELRECFPGKESDPHAAASRIAELTRELAVAYPPTYSLTPEDRSVMEYNLSETETEYRAFVAEEIAEKDVVTALWYVRAWATVLLSSHATATSRIKRQYMPPSKPYSIWGDILGNPRSTSVELFVGWVDKLFESISIHDLKDNGKSTDVTPRA